MTVTITTKNARKAITAAAAAYKRGEINRAQFRAIATQGLANEIRSTLQQKSASYYSKYAPKFIKK